MRFAEHRESLRQKRLREPQSVHARARARAVIGAMARVGAADLLLRERIPAKQIFRVLTSLEESERAGGDDVSQALREVLAVRPDGTVPPLHTFRTFVLRNRSWVREVVESLNEDGGTR